MSWQFDIAPWNEDMVKIATVMEMIEATRRYKEGKP